MSYDYRMVYTKLWREDSWFSEELDTEGKLFWLYLLTNSSANASGVYQLRASVAAVETGIPRDRCDTLLNAFERAGKLRREGDTVWIIKMREYQTRGSRSPKIMACIHASLRAVSDCRLKVEYATTYGEDLVRLLQNPSSLERLQALPTPSPSPAPTPSANAPNGTKAAEAAKDPLTFAVDYLSKKEGANGKAFNPVGSLAYLFKVRFGETYKPDYGRLGKIAQMLGNDYIAVARLIWNCSVPEGDPHDYLTRIAAKSPVRRTAAKTPATTFATTNDESDEFWQKHLAQENGNGRA